MYNFAAYPQNISIIKNCSSLNSRRERSELSSEQAQNRLLYFGKKIKKLSIEWRIQFKVLKSIFIN